MGYPYGHTLACPMYGASYLTTFKDDNTRYKHEYLISHKLEPSAWFKNFKNLAENQLDKTIKALRIYHSREYLFDKFNKIYKDRMINIPLSIPYRTPTKLSVGEIKYDLFGHA